MKTTMSKSAPAARRGRCAFHRSGFTTPVFRSTVAVPAVAGRYRRCRKSCRNLILRRIGSGVGFSLGPSVVAGSGDVCNCRQILHDLGSGATSLPRFGRDPFQYTNRRWYNKSRRHAEHKHKQGIPHRVHAPPVSEFSTSILNCPGEMDKCYTA